VSSPIIWIFTPAFISIGLFLLLRHRRLVYLIGFLLSLGLTGAAYWLPIETLVSTGSTGFKISGVLTILGRQLVLNQDRQAILILIYAITAFWLFGGMCTNVPPLLVPVSLLVVSFLVGSIAVDPFLYAAIFIEIAVLLTLPLLVNDTKRLNTGAMRFLTYQTIGMVFLLFTGWLLGGVETAPADRAAALRTLVFLGLGFAFILAIFPFYSWMPMLTEYENPYIVGFILILFPTVILLFGITFIEKYTWLRSSNELKQALQIVGTFMVVIGGIWSAFQKNLGRMFGYAVIVENGFSLIAIGTLTPNGYQVFANMFLPRILSFGLWALCLSIIRKKFNTLELAKLGGVGKSETLITLGILVAQFSIGGLPLLGGFPLRVALLEEISLQSVVIAWSIIIGIGGIWAAGLISLSTALRSESSWKSFFSENIVVNALVCIGIVGLLIMGLLPQMYTSGMLNILLPYSHLY
jgi:NADH-quinone oxidoreductase subunit N